MDILSKTCILSHVSAVKSGDIAYNDMYASVCVCVCA